MDLQQRAFPNREALRQYARQSPEMDISAVEVLLQILQTSLEIHQQVYAVLEKRHMVSEGKLMVMMILYQEPLGLAPSVLAEKVGVTRATISAMLQRMIRDKLACAFSDASDGRRKLVGLTETGRAFLDEILPDHFMREAELMHNVTEEERSTLVRLLKKIKAN